MNPVTSTRADRRLLELVSALRQPILIRCLLLLTVTYVAIISLPQPWVPYGTGLDASWILGLNLAHGQGMVAGRDIVFSYGPLGYLLHPDPVCGTPIIALLHRIGLYLLSLAALCRLVWIHPSKVAAFWTAVVLGLGVVLDPGPGESQGFIALTAVALLALVDRSGWRLVESSLLAVLAGLEFLVKLNQGVEGIAIFLAVMAAAIIESRPLDSRARRLWLAVAGVLPLSIAILFWAATGSLPSLAGYVRSGWEVVSGYSEGMGLPGPIWQAALACATIAATFAAVLLVAGNLRALLPGLTPALIVAFFAFKHAMVRQDAHAAGFQTRFAIGLLFLLVCARLPRDRRLILVLEIFSMLMAYAIIGEQFPGSGTDIQARLELRRAGSTLAAFRHWPATWDDIRTIEQFVRAPLRLPARFHEIVGNGTVDAEPWDVDIVEANGWRWQPRPVFQSYGAYTPLLDRMNAEHLESNRAADFVLLNFSAVDGRHPLLEAPLAWRALLDRYDLKLSGVIWLVLQHRDLPRYGPLVGLGNSTAHWDEEVPVPRESGLLVMGPRISPSLTGKVESTLFRSAAVYVDSVFSSGKSVHWRCVPRNLAAGYLIHPFPQSLKELQSLFVPDMFPASPDRIVAVRFHAEKPGEFSPEIPIAWSLLPETASQRPPSDAPKYPFPKTSLTPLWRAGDQPPQASNARTELRPHWIEVTPTTEDPELLFHIGPALGRFCTLIVRARFQKTDRIDAFFGKQVDGRGVSGVVPVANQWLDVYLNVGQNPFWEDEHGATLRFDPVSSAGAGTTADIAGIWGSTQAAPPLWPEVQFYPVPPSEAPRP